MTHVGFHASHEQVAPADLLEATRSAERAGFTHAMCSDHLTPWSSAQGESGFAWSWLGAALEATALPFGVVTAPGQRYHPAVLAQAIATLAAMYPGRFWAALGSGEAMNEHVTGDRWPAKHVRNARLLECVEVMRALLGGEEVDHEGLVRVDRARLWSLPEVPPRLVAAAVSPETAGWAASWGDGLITVNQPLADLERTITAYRDAGGRGEVAVQTHVCVAPTLEEARGIALDQWRTNVFDPPLIWDLDTPLHYEKAAAHVTADDVEGAVVVTDSPDRVVEVIGEYADLGADAVYLHHVGKDQRYFLQTMAEHVLPQLGEPR